MSRSNPLNRLPRRFAAWVLAWFGLMVAMGALAPAMNPQALAWLCSATPLQVGGGTASGEDPANAPAAMGHGGLCPLCSTPPAPPPTMLALPLPLPAWVLRLPPPALPAVRLSHAATPAPARGPPVLLA